MLISITSIKLRHLWQYFPLTWNAYKIVQQLKNAEGHLGMKNTGLAYWHYTLSAWESKEHMQKFVKTGAHASAMKKSAKISKEIWFYNYESENLPTWKVAKKWVFEKGRRQVY